jgi:hypothetical protein
MSGQNQDPKNPSRRDFLTQIGVGVAMAVPVAIAGQALFSSTAFAASDTISESDPAAKALNYYANAKKVDTKKFPKRAGPEGAKQFCWTCALYQATDSKNPKADANAVCALLAGKKVNSNGWCNSWAQNPNIKV